MNISTISYIELTLFTTIMHCGLLSGDRNNVTLTNLLLFSAHTVKIQWQALLFRPFIIIFAK